MNPTFRQPTKLCIIEPSATGQPAAANTALLWKRLCELATCAPPHEHRPRCSGHENCGAFEPAGAEIGEGLVRPLERIACGRGDNANLRRQAQEIDPILPSEIGDRNELSLTPKQPVGETGDIAHMDTCANDPPALADCLQRNGYEAANGRKDDCTIERFRRYLVGATRPGRSDAPGEGLAGNVSWPRESEHRSPLPPRDLRDDMGRGAKAVETQVLALADSHQRA